MDLKKTAFANYTIKAMFYSGTCHLERAAFAIGNKNNSPRLKNLRELLFLAPFSLELFI